MNALYVHLTHADEMEKLLEQENITPAQREEYEVIKASADALSQEELGEKLRKYNVKSPEGENDISDPLPFNLMFDTSIGPTGNVKGLVMSSPCDYVKQCKLPTARNCARHICKLS